MGDADWKGMATEAAAALKGEATPSWAVVLGSGLQEPDYFDPGSPVREWDFAEIPHFTCPTVPGHRGSLQAGTIAGQPVLVQRGRVHYYECLDFNTVTFYLRVLRELGVERVVLTNAAGALNPVFERGDLMLVRDHINMMGGNPILSLPPGPGPGNRFLDLSGAYDKGLGGLAMSIAPARGIRMAEGTLVAVSGPCYETGAELRFFRMAGGDAVSMSMVPETVFARWLGMRVTGISCITNTWDLRQPHAVSHSEVLDTARDSAGMLKELVRALIEEAARAGI